MALTERASVELRPLRDDEVVSVKGREQLCVLSVVCSHKAMQGYTPVERVRVLGQAPVLRGYLGQVKAYGHWCAALDHLVERYQAEMPADYPRDYLHEAVCHGAR